MPLVYWIFKETLGPVRTDNLSDSSGLYCDTAIGILDFQGNSGSSLIHLAAMPTVMHTRLHVNVKTLSWNDRIGRDQVVTGKIVSMAHLWPRWFSVILSGSS